MKRGCLIINMVIGFLILVFFVPPTFSHNSRQFKLPDGSYISELSISEESLKDGHNKKALGTAVMNPVTGLPKFIHGFKTKPLGKDGKMAAKEFLKMHFDSLKIDTSTLDNANETEVGNTKHVRFQQMYRNVPVEMAEVLVHMTKDGEIIGLSSNYQPDLDIDVTPQITADEALAVFLKDLGIELPEDESTIDAGILPPSPDIAPKEGFGIASHVLLGLENPLKPVLLGPKLVIHPKAKGMKKASLSWKISYSGKDVGSWIYFIDAHTGKIISIHDARNRGSKGTENARIYLNDAGDVAPSIVLLCNGYISTYYYNYGWYWYDTDITDPLGWWDSYYGRYFHFNVDYNTACIRKCTWVPYYPYRRCYCNYYEGHGIQFRLAGPKCWVVNERNNYDAWMFSFDINHIPAIKDYNHDYDPYNLDLLFDSANVFYHVNESLYNYYLAEHDFDLGHQVRCITHVSDPTIYAQEDGITRYIYFSDGRPALGYPRNPTWAREGILHELQHVVSDKIYEPNLLGNGKTPELYMEKSLLEAFSDYFACAQTGDATYGEWTFAMSPDLIRHLDGRRNMSDYSDQDLENAYHDNSLIYSSALWEIRGDLGITYLTIDQLAFQHLFWLPRSFYQACNAYLSEAENEGISTPDIWNMNYIFARHGITDNLMMESFSDGEADGWQTLEGLWHISSNQANLTPFSLAYNQAPPNPSDYNVGQTSGDAILKIEHLNEFDDADVSFWFWYEIESSVLPWPRDKLIVSLSTDGVIWTTILDSSSSDSNLWNPGWSQKTWCKKTYSLQASEIVSSLLLKFSFDSVNADDNQFEGWYIDDIQVKNVDGNMF